MFILYAIVAGLVVGFLLGGRPAGLASITVRWSAPHRRRHARPGRPVLGAGHASGSATSGRGPTCSRRASCSSRCSPTGASRASRSWRWVPPPTSSRSSPTAATCRPAPGDGRPRPGRGHRLLEQRAPRSSRARAADRHLLHPARASRSPTCSAWATCSSGWASPSRSSWPCAGRRPMPDPGAASSARPTGRSGAWEPVDGSHPDAGRVVRREPPTNAAATGT